MAMCQAENQLDGLLLLTVPGPARLRGTAQDLAPLFRADVAPARGAKTERKPLHRRWRQSFRGDIDKFQSEVEHDFWRQTCVAHHGLESLAASCAECAREVRAKFEAWWI
jgi:hypothetical protein